MKAGSFDSSVVGSFESLNPGRVDALVDGSFE